MLFVQDVEYWRVGYAVAVRHFNLQPSVAFRIEVEVEVVVEIELFYLEVVTHTGIEP